MVRRKPYSKVKKFNQIRAQHVKGMGDVVFLGFQCLNPECQNYIFVRKDEIDNDFDIKCPVCGYHLYTGGETNFYDYELEVKTNGENQIVDTGQFSIFHDEYLDYATEYKYCIVCNTLRPIEDFDKHSSRKSGRQGECRQCKKIYNSIKNGTRITDQHRESAQKRRLLLDIANQKVDSKRVYENYNYKCFNCGKDLYNVSSAKERPLDHTLPIYYLWPLTTETATLLCQKCNGEKTGSWPSKFYTPDKLKLLSLKTGIPYDVLAGAPQYNPYAINKLSNSYFVDELLVKYNKYMEKAIIPLRNRLLHDINFDFFKSSKLISCDWIEIANKEYHNKYSQ
ncbi:hypothetical protein ACFIJ5_18805 (plasmid) [Haloimpatiens sp. FM7330]|uniref:hypothetical protein n=1 Tax=Haloimpatiens sp. FM7330 TaxID=3298610 RepID=UPI003641736D